MIHTATQPLTILIVTPDDDMRTVLSEALREEHYEPVGYATAERALLTLSDQLYTLALLDISALGVTGRLVASQPLATLRKCLAPIPVVALTTQPHKVGALANNYAFVESMPFELETLLAHIAEAIDQALTSEQEEQARLVTAYFAALQSEDEAAFMATLADDAILNTAEDAVIADTRRIAGQDAIRSYMRNVWRQYRQIITSQLRIYARPTGLASRCLTAWTTLTGEQRRLLVTTLFRFRGGRITQVCLRGSLQHAHTLSAAPIQSTTYTT